MSSNFDALAFACIAWSLGSAQITYIIIGPATLAFGLYKTVDLTLWSHVRRTYTVMECWKPFAAATASLIPIIGGLVAAKMLDA